jgi:hypothetical protein
VSSTAIGVNDITAGVTLPLVANGPFPLAFTAATRKMYAVPFVSPVTVALAAVDAACENVVQVLPLLLEYCTV